MTTLIKNPLDKNVICTDDDIILFTYKESGAYLVRFYLNGYCRLKARAKYERGQ